MLGPITAVLHGAGVNVPRPIGSLDEAAFLKTLAPRFRVCATCSRPSRPTASSCWSRSARSSPGRGFEARRTMGLPTSG